MTEADDDLPSPAPRKDDVLFGTGDEFPMANACLNFTTGDYGYREGYRRAGKILAEHVCNECRDQDLLVFPIVHNYRHHVELTLKHLIGVGSYLSDREITPEVQRLLFTSHNLDRLWHTLKPILFAVGESVGWNPETDDIDGVESYIQQLHTVDRGSFSFRYATGTEGEPSLPGMRHLNIYTFASNMERLADYLETIVFGFSMEEDQKQEYEADMRSYEPNYDGGYYG